MRIVTALRDGLANMMSGAGTTADKRVHAIYAMRHVDPAQIEAAYRTSWLMRKIIDVPAYDETREWRIWQAKETEIEALEAEEKRLQIRHKVRRARTLARLHGGGAILLGVGAGDPMEPLDSAKVRKGELRYMHVFSRWELSEGQKRLDPEDPWFGQPEHFAIRGARGAQVRIHPSRIVAFIGQAAPESSYITNHSWFWGDPLMQSIEDAVKNADLAQNGFASLIDEARVDITKMPDLMTNAGSAEYEARFLRRLELAALGKSTHRMLVIDAAEEWEQRQVTWSGMPEIIQSYLQLVSGAADIPVTRLLGQSPAGMNSTGESDLRNYYDSVAAKQENDLRPLLDRIDDVLLPSVFGSRPADIWFDFAPLWQMSPKEKADVDKIYADIAESDARSGLLPIEALAAGRRGRVIEDGIYPGIEAALEQADRELAEAPDEDDEDPNEMQATKPEPRRRAANDAAAWLADATPRPLYVQRKLLNAAELIAWAKASGFETTLAAADMHVTILYSRQPVDPMKMGRAWNEDERGHIVVRPGGPRVIERLGENAVVLRFAAPDLEWRHREMIEAGGSHDWPEYAPHVTLSYGVPADVDLDAFKPFNGELRFGPEIFEPLDLNWKSKVVEDGGAPTGGRPFVDGKRRKARRGGGRGFDESKHPRGPMGRFVSTGGVSTREHVRRLAREATTNRQLQLRVTIGPVRNGAEIEARVGGSVADFKRTMDADHIRKTLRDHGSSSTEASRRSGPQIAVTRRDFELANRIVREGRIVKAVRAKGRGSSASVTYEAMIGETRYFYVERINRGVREAAFKTMWKKPL